MNIQDKSGTILAGKTLRAAPLAILGKPTPKYASVEHFTQLTVRQYIKEGRIKPNMLNASGTGIIVPADFNLGDPALDGRSNDFAPAK